MNKVQQEIMEIIEPYMDKTLDKGCLVEHLEARERGELQDVPSWIIDQLYEASGRVSDIIELPCKGLC